MEPELELDFDLNYPVPLSKELPGFSGSGSEPGSIPTCKYCDKSLWQIGKMKNHERHHTGEKRFACDCCDKTFNIAEQLKRHMRIHTGEKPFTCKHCDKKFTQLSSLKRH